MNSKNRNSQKNDHKSEKDDGPQTLALLQKIKAGQIEPKSIGKTERMLLVCFLMTEGNSNAEIAHLLKVSDRSIERDKQAIRKTNALAADPELVEQMVGRLVCEAELSVQRIRKAARDKDTPQAVKVDAEHRCYQIVGDMITSLQRLGYLPTATTRLQADFTHNIGQIPDFSQMQAEVQRLRQITGETQGTDPQLTEQLNQIETELVKVKLVNKIENISNIVESGEIQNESG